MTTNESMGVTPTGIAVALAVAVALGMLFFGSSIFAPFASAPQGDTQFIEATTTNDGVMDTGEEVIGTGAVAVPGTKVTVNYVGMLENGEVFDASANHGGTFTFTLGAGEVIQGWDMGIAGMKEGGKRRLVIPPELGYGARAVGPIPASSTLVFDVELIKVGE